MRLWGPTSWGPCSAVGEGAAGVLVRFRHSICRAQQAGYWLESQRVIPCHGVYTCFIPIAHMCMTIVWDTTWSAG